MPHLPFQWYGNKRREVPALLAAIRADRASFRRVVEPFAGSGALAFALWEADPGIAVVLNDTDERLVAFYQQVRLEGLAPLDEYARAHSTSEAWRSRPKDPATVEDWYYHQVVRLGRFQHGKDQLPRFPTLVRNRRQARLHEFLAHAAVSCGDWRTALDPLSLMDPHVLIYLDPPYFSSFNQTYYGQRQTHDEQGFELDHTRMFVEIKQLLEDPSRACAVLFSINGSAIVRELYRPWVVGDYEKAYSGVVKRAGRYVQNKTRHLVVYAPPRDLELEPV